MAWSDWAHVILGTHGSWLPGDSRGFRDHDHRVHSSGGYRGPSPPNEHVGLHRLALEHCPNAIVIPQSCRAIIAEAIVSKLADDRYVVGAICVAGQHAHILVHVGPGDAKRAIGRAKQFASHRVRDSMPGTLWSQGCHVVRVRDEQHFGAIHDDILAHVNEGAFAWSNPDLYSRTRSGPASKDRVLRRPRLYREP